VHYIPKANYSQRQALEVELSITIGQFLFASLGKVPGHFHFIHLTILVLENKLNLS